MIWMAGRNREQGELVAEILREASALPRERRAVIAGGLPGAPKAAVLERHAAMIAAYRRGQLGLEGLGLEFRARRWPDVPPLPAGTRAGQRGDRRSRAVCPGFLR